MGPSGAKGIVWRGTWSPIDTYLPDDGVEFNGSAYIALALNVSLPPPSTDWQLLASRGADGAAGAGGPQGPKGDAGPAGASGTDGISVTATSLVPGHPACPTGGAMLQSASGDVFVCNGTPGLEGPQGASGPAGLAGVPGASTVAQSLAPGDDPVCPAGGTRFLTSGVVTYACSGVAMNPCASTMNMCGGACVNLLTDGSNCGMCGTTCGSRMCFGGSCAKQVFVTSLAYTGAMGGVSGADSKCQERAIAAGLAGTFRAWIANEVGQSPAFTFTRSPSPYVLVGGTIVANDWADLVSGTLRHAINRTEYGAAEAAPGGTAWTGMEGSGIVQVGYNCNGWTSASGNGEFGRIETTSSAWFAGGTYPCNTPMVIYCFEQ